MNYSEAVTADRRLVILKVLEGSTGYTCNEHLLGTVLASFGHQVGQDRLRTDLAWLQEQGLLATETVAGVQIAKINQRGLDVANGLSSVPGVKRPAP